MLTLQQIITEADTLVPNAYTTADKIPWLNAIHQDFFNIVKIPKIQTFAAVSGQSEYTLAADVRAKNIDLVRVGLTRYRVLGGKPTDAAWSYDDITKKLTLSVAPYKADQGIVRYFRIATTTFLTTDLNAVPDAPEEYHWTFVLALCSEIALAQDDTAKAMNFDAKYLEVWNNAAQEYAKGLTS